MQASMSLSPSQLGEYLLNVATVRPMFIWGAPGIGKSALLQKAFYSLIHERRVGECELPAGSVLIGAGNRAQDPAIVKPTSSALMNRMVHVKCLPYRWYFAMPRPTPRAIYWPRRSLAGFTYVDANLKVI